ncbi:MAG: hypothetical protein ACK4OM_07605 [Alphaproteobacteria bacterium]
MGYFQKIEEKFTNKNEKVKTELEIEVYFNGTGYSYNYNVEYGFKNIDGEQVQYATATFNKSNNVAEALSEEVLAKVKNISYNLSSGDKYINLPSDEMIKNFSYALRQAVSAHCQTFKKIEPSIQLASPKPVKQYKNITIDDLYELSASIPNGKTLTFIYERDEYTFSYSNGTFNIEHEMVSENRAKNSTVVPIKKDPIINKAERNLVIIRKMPLDAIYDNIRTQLIGQGINNLPEPVNQTATTPVKPNIAPVQKEETSAELKKAKDIAALDEEIAKLQKPALINSIYNLTAKLNSGSEYTHKFGSKVLTLKPESSILVDNKSRSRISFLCTENGQSLLDRTFIRDNTPGEEILKLNLPLDEIIKGLEQEIEKQETKSIQKPANDVHNSLKKQPENIQTQIKDNKPSNVKKPILDLFVTPGTSNDLLNFESKKESTILPVGQKPKVKKVVRFKESVVEPVIKLNNPDSEAKAKIDKIFNLTQKLSLGNPSHSVGLKKPLGTLYLNPVGNLSDVNLPPNRISIRFVSSEDENNPQEKINKIFSKNDIPYTEINNLNLPLDEITKSLNSKLVIQTNAEKAKSKHSIKDSDNDVKPKPSKGFKLSNLSYALTAAAIVGVTVAVAYSAPYLIPYAVKTTAYLASQPITGTIVAATRTIMSHITRVTGVQNVAVKAVASGITAVALEKTAEIACNTATTAFNWGKKIIEERKNKSQEPIRQ